MKLFLAVSFFIALARAEGQCGMYLAQSSTSTIEEPKWGIYAGTDIFKGAAVGSPEIAIHTLNLKGSQRGIDEVPSSGDLTVDFLEQFMWVPDATGGKYEVSLGRIVTAITGPGVLGALNVKLTNADWDHLAAYKRQSMGELPTVAHPGRGAYTSFYNVTLKSKDKILAGTEIFLDYGDNWEGNEDDEEELSKSDYAKVDAMVHQIAEFMEKYKDELDATQRTEVYDFLVKDILGAAAGATKGSLITSLLPANPDELSKVIESGSSLLYSVPSAKRSMEWLQTNGFCLDNLKVGASTIEYAGRGAFAQRALKNGSTVAPVPLVHVPDKSVMDIYYVEKNQNEGTEQLWHRSSTSNEPYAQQLLLNYCFGHPESNMLFFPAASGSAFINHSPAPNAKLVWSDHSLHHKEWYESSPATLLDEEHAYLGLLMEIVAIRDIEEGEEIFLDYGSDWQIAWEEHVATWTKNVSEDKITNPWPVRALELNDAFKTKGFRTKSEFNDSPYPENIRQMCFLVVETLHDAEESFKSWTMPSKGGTTYDTDNLFDCTVVERIALDESTENGPAFNYTVEWVDKETDEITVVHNVPHLAITFLDQPDTGDQWVAKGAFRHYIGIPDEIFPRGPWRDAAFTEK